MDKGHSIEFFEIGPSRIKKIFLAVMHGLAFSACWINGLYVEIKVILSVLVALSLFLQLRSYNAETTFRLRYSAHSGWALALFEDQFSPFVLNSASILTVWVAVLYCSSGNEPRVVVVFRDALHNGGDYRRLLAVLRISGL